MKNKINLILLIVCFLGLSLINFTGCTKVLSFTAPTNIKYDGSIVTWDAVKDANQYIVKVNEGAEVTVSTNSFGYMANGTQFNFTVKASSSTAKVKSAEQTTVSFSYLGKIEDNEITISDEGYITWNAIPNATAYELKTSTGIENIYATEYQLPVGETSFQIRPIVIGDDTKYSLWSTAKKYTKCDVTDFNKISYDGTYITFEAVNGAQKYEIYINGKAEEELINTRKYAYDAKNEGFSVAIKAIGNHSNSFDGDISSEKKFVFLDMVTGLKVKEGKLFWNGDENKVYSLKINNKVIEVTGSEYAGDLLVTGTNLDVSIKEIATDATYFSSYSSPISMYILPAPTLKWSQLTSLDGGENSMSWNNIAGATGYTITVVRPDGSSEPFSYGETQTSFSYDYEAVGTYTVTIVANAGEENGITSSSKASLPFTVIRPGRPEQVENGFITSNNTVLSDGFTVTCKTQSADYKYKLYKNGLQDGEVSSVPQFTRKNLIENDVIEGQEDTYSIQIIGKINSENRVTLNSIETLDFKITILGMPQNLHMDGFTLLYDQVAFAVNNYWVTGVNGGTGIEGNEYGVDLSAYLKSGGYSMQVCAKGNGSDVLPSNYSQYMKVFRLGAPTNIRIDTNTAQNGVLKYDVSEMATGVELYLGSKDATYKVESSSNVLENMNSQIQEGGTYVSLVAVGNYLSEDGIYYISSDKSTAKEFVKIAAPTNLTFDNSHLMWNQTGVSEAQTGIISYEVYNGSGVLFKPTQNDRSVDLTDLEGGRTYVFSIRAIGDGERYINSDLSTAEQVYKLTSPTITLKNGKYVWQAVSNATSYSVTVDGKLYSTEVHTTGTELSFDPVGAFEQIKTYQTIFTAVGNGAVGELKTISSSPVIIKQVCVQLAKPTFSLSYDKDYYDEQGNILVNITTEVPYTNGYRYAFNGITVEKTGEGASTCAYNPKNTGEYQVYVNALGGLFNDKNEYMLTSPTSGGQNTVITLLATPDKLSIRINYDGFLSFSAIPSADEYEMIFYINGSTKGYTVKNATPEYDLSAAIQKGLLEGISSYKDVSSLKVEVRALSKTSTKVSSQISYNEWTNDLHN